MEKGRIVAIVGATASGKTGVGEAIARRLDAEIVCADSRQVFRELDVGTGKPSLTERAERSHHLFDVLGLGQRATAGWYAHAAGETCAAIHRRGRLPILVGGSGLYLKAIQSGLSGEPPHAPEIRARLGSELRERGPEELHRRLAVCDPATAARLKPRDAQRIARALEVFEASGRPLSWWHAQPHRLAIDAEWRVFEISVATRVLTERITRRTRAMFDSGLIEETRAIVASGHGEALRGLRAVGYDEALELIAGRIERSEAEERTTLRTRQLAKRQRTWFRHQVQAVRLAGDSGDIESMAEHAVERLHHDEGQASTG